MRFIGSDHKWPLLANSGRSEHGENEAAFGFKADFQTRPVESPRIAKSRGHSARKFPSGLSRSLQILLRTVRRANGQLSCISLQMMISSIIEARSRPLIVRWACHESEDWVRLTAGRNQLSELSTTSSKGSMRSSSPPCMIVSCMAMNGALFTVRWDAQTRSFLYRDAAAFRI